MQRAIAPEISTWPDDRPQLLASTCDDCGATVFPVQPLCPRCSRDQMTDVALPRTGTLVAWTTQGFLPGAPYLGDETPETFVPFGVGLVQLGDVVRVEGRLTQNSPAVLEFGMEVELTMIPLGHDENGDEVLTFAFRPIDPKGVSQ
ncbi:DNA-binding protein [Rhodococcus sp. HNM0563]|uniref:OB-fold domain-containing protein n=1 Tax=unclassified Rhodococcus (in: high G+C Gram-positive bacteria) TaxID=192944 RepID=UPI00146D9E57|nr:OB-fold domain-containing protein [Rhodococcus sp. F64268]MCK0091796.1 OB-fold domain-containing protein [Rhodococcus sp. F64268]NLU64135.1 DNA-binding protein [Rhodococcus sp. HNM0563]